MTQPGNTAMPFGKRIPARLPQWHDMRMQWWAYAKGVPKTTLAQNVLQARVEANEGQIEKMLEDLAKSMGLPVDELKAKILEEAGVRYDDADDES